jgi:hypothetical protein
MRCKKAQKLIIAYLDHELSARKQTAVQTHLSHCPVCSAELESYKKLNGIIEQLPKVEDRSPLFWQHQVKAIEQKVAAVQSGKVSEPAEPLRWHKPAWYKYAAATATISVVAIVFIVNQSHQPVSSIVAIKNESNQLFAAKPSISGSIDTDKKIDRLRRIQSETVKSQPIDTREKSDRLIMNQPEPSKSQLPEIINKKSISPSKTEKEIGDKVALTPKATALYDINADGTENIAAKQIAKAPAAPVSAAAALMPSKKDAVKEKGLEGFAYSTVPEESRMETKLGAQRNAKEWKAIEQVDGDMELARGTSLNFGLQQSTQQVFFGHGTMGQSTQAVPAAIQAGGEFNLAFDSAAQKMLQNAMEMMVQTNFPNQQNQRTIEIREIPQPATTSPRHLQIKMEFQP